MRKIATLVGALLVLGGWTQYDAACGVNLPSEQQIRTMPYSFLYKNYKLALRASEMRADFTIMHKPVPPCIAAMADRVTQYEHEMKFR
jgi:hypothetical protein